MPKIIKNLEETLLSTAKRIIDEEGYGALSMRRLADECHVALGTIYNYIEGKDKIVAKLMIVDWLECASKMEKASANKDFVKGIGLMYDALADFCEKNQRTWKEYAQGGGAFLINSDHHIMLQKKLEECVKALAKGTGNDDLAKFAMLLGETIVAAAVQENVPKSQLTALAKKLTLK